MARLIPTFDECVDRAGWLNTGELRVLDQLVRLDDDWTVYVQPRLGLDMPDFVALHDEHGVCAIEVKDWTRGRYRTRSGVLECRSSATEWIPVDHPRLQAARYGSAIFEDSFAFPEDGETIAPAVRSLVVLLNHRTREANDLLSCARRSPGAQADVIGEDDLPALERALIGPTPARPSSPSMSRLRRHLDSATFFSRLVHEEPLSGGAANIAKNANGAKMRRVRGSAGSGKSYGLAARAAALAAQGESVLVVSYNVTLSHYLRHLVTRHCATYGADPTLVSCTHFHAFCGRIVSDATARGIDVPSCADGMWTEQSIRRAIAATELGHRVEYGAVLVDEGQDFKLDWWNLLRQHVRAGGEMLLVSDPTQNIYGVPTWTEQDHMVGAGFSGPWTDLGGSYRLPSDMIAILRTFGESHVRGEVVGPRAPGLDDSVARSTSPTRRTWRNVQPGEDPALLLAHATAELLENTPGLDPSEVVILCETHEAGQDAVGHLERMGIDVHHIFSTDRREQRRRKSRFWPDAGGVKGSTIHSYKGWESRAVVLGIGDGRRSARLAYVAMTRLQADRGGRSSYLSVVNACRRLDGFQPTFLDGVPLPPPTAVHRVA